MKIFTGKTIEEAQRQAMEDLKLKDQQELVYKVVQEPRHGFLGIGRRLAKIEVTVKQRASTTPAPVHVKQPVEDQHVNSSAPTQPSPEEMQARHRANLKRVRQVGEELAKYLTEVLATMEIDAQPTVTAVRSHEIEIDLASPQPGRIIGRHGRRINALEQVSVAFMNYHGVPKTNVILDTSNYRQRRQEMIHQLAQRTVTEVVASGQAVFLDPMPARERKQLHQELEKNTHVKTYSHGREPYRSVVVAPRN